MPNPHKGEVGFECEGVAYTLHFSTNALCELEDALDQGINTIAAQLADVGSLRLKTVRAVFWAGLRDHHPALTLQDAGAMLTILTLPKALEHLGQAFEAAFPNVEENTGRPPQPGPAPDPAKDGIGSHSSANGASSATPTKGSGRARPATSPATSPPARPS